MNFVFVLFCSIAFASLVACGDSVHKEIPPSPTPAPSASPGEGATPTPQPSPQDAKNQSRCEMVSEVLVLKGRIVRLPAMGRMVMESHLVAQEDKVRWPKNGTDGIGEHIARSCSILQRKYGVKDCSKVYYASFQKVWTPSEHGNIGQGSSSIPPQEQEMLSGNMMWTLSSRPKPGTKFLARANGKAVVFVMGYETGPGDVQRWLGGLQTEVHYFLGTSNSSQIQIGRLKDQSLPIGPISCP